MALHTMNALSFLLIILTIISHLPQYDKLRKTQSSAGISTLAVVLHALIAQAQVLSLFFLFKLAPMMRYGTPVASPRSARDWLNLAQILTQWLCSVLQLLMVVRHRYSDASSTNPSSSTSITAANLLSPAAVAIAPLILQGALYVLISQTLGKYNDYFCAFMSFVNRAIFNPIATLFVVIAFVRQAVVAYSDADSTALSTGTLAFQMAIFTALAVSWPYRLILPPNLWELGAEPVWIMEWYPWVGWACVNSALYAAGQAVVLLCAATTARSVAP